MKNIFVAYTIAAIITLGTIHYKWSTQQELTIDVAYSQLTNQAKTEVDCLTQNVYFEAGSESEKGQLAVAMVTIKRTKLTSFPETICGVVKQKINNICQFSWWCNPDLKHKSVKYTFSQPERQKLEDIRKVAMEAYLNYDNINDPTKGAAFYHADYVDPKWNLKKTAKIGNHIFYKGSW